MQKLLQQWKEQKLNKENRDKNKNRGSAMVLVVSTVAIIGVFAITLLAITLMTLRMKVTQMRSQENFYDAERVLDDITLGLQKRVSDAAGAAYTYTMERYSSSSAAIRQSNFQTMFENELLKTNPAGMEPLIDPTKSTAYAKLYNKEALRKMVSDEAKQAPVCNVDTVGGTNANVLNVDSVAGTYTFKNLQVTYIDARDYMTVIQTDIVVTCPPINFNQQATAALDLTSFVFIANEQSQMSGGDISVAGSAYLGTDDEAAKRYATDYKTGTISFEPVGDNTRLITGGTMFINQGANVIIKGACATWARNIEVEHASVSLGVTGSAHDGTAITTTGNTFVNNDIVLGNSSTVKAAGQLFAYGTLTTSEAIYGSTAVNNNPAAYSSAILINGKDATLDMSELDNFIIAGTAYVNAERNSIAQQVTPIGGNKNIPMGESITMKANQRAYMVPAQFIAPFCASGGSNPMLGDRYLSLEKELADKFYGGDTTKVTSMDYLRASETAAVGVPFELAQYGVVGIQKEVYPMDNNTQMVYFFMVFASQEDVNEFADTYYAKNKNLTTLQGRIAANRFNTNITYSQAFKDKENAPTDYTFYYNGCVLVPDGVNTRVLSGKLNSTTTDYAIKLNQNTSSYQTTFASLRHTLMMSSSLTSEVLSKSVYDNTVHPMTTADPNTNIPLGSKKVFATAAGGGIAPDAQMCAIVINNKGGSPYVLTNPTTDTYHEATEMVGSQRLPVHVVIASGDVEVKCNFRGMIIAGGKIIIDNQNKSLLADSNLTQQALRIADINGVRAVDYLVAGDSCLTGNSGGQNGTNNNLAFAEYVTYSNWKKQ